MKLLYYFSLLLLFSASTCKKEGDNCHYDLMFTNQSSADTIIYALEFYYDSLCVLQGTYLLPDESYTESLRICWENSLSEGRTHDIYVVSPSQYNNPEIFYDCDSIQYKNTILKKYELSLKDLQDNDFKVTSCLKFYLL